MGAAALPIRRLESGDLGYLPRPVVTFDLGLGPSRAKPTRAFVLSMCFFFCVFLGRGEGVTVPQVAEIS